MEKKLFRFSLTFALGLVLLGTAFSAFVSTSAQAGGLRSSRDWNQDFSLAQSSAARMDALKSALQRHSQRAASVLEQTFSQEPRSSIRAQMVRTEHALKPRAIVFF